MSETLKGRQLADAVAYNRERDYEGTTVEMIQRVVGARVDGILGPGTARRVFAWQGKQGLRRDGKVGSKTLEKIRAADDAPSGADAEVLGHGVWVDTRARSALEPEFIDAMRSLHFSTLALMTNRSTANPRSTQPWTLNWTTKTLAQMRERAEGFKLVLTIWPLPSREQQALIARDLPGLIEASGAVEVEIDTEGNWLAKRLEGFASMEDAAKSLVDTLRGAAGESVRLALSTYTYHPENGPKALVAPHMDVVHPQAYSTYNAKRAQRNWDGAYGPGAMQTLTYERARRIPKGAGDKPEIQMGLAAYRQNFPGHSVQEAMQKAYDRARELGASELRWWSSANIMSHKNPDAAAMRSFFRRLSPAGKPTIAEIEGMHFNIEDMREVWNEADEESESER